MQRIDEEKEKLTGREDGAEGKKEKKKKKGKHRKKGHHKKKDGDDKDRDDRDGKRSALSNDQFIINGNYNLIKMLGFGAFGEIHLAYDTNTKLLRAIKFEIASHKNPQLKHEHSILEQLNKPDNNNPLPPDGYAGIPRVYLFDRMENKFNYMVMDFLGPSLSDLFQFKEKSFSLETVLMIGIQILTRIEFIHEKGFIHRDIKPENFVIGLNEKSNVVHIIDFGLSKRYKDKNTGQHIPYRENRHLVGTVRYASINAHLGVEQSRRDDIESIGYVLAYFFLGRLPWQSKQDKIKAPVNKIMEKKLITPPEILCKRMPMEFAYYFHYCKNLKFEDRPDYTTLKCLFADLLSSRIKLENEFVFDWFDDGNLNRKEVKGIDRNQNNEVKEKSEREEKSEHEEEEEKQDDGITPGGDEDGVKGKGKDEPISLFNETKKGDDDGAKVPKHDGEVIQLKATKQDESGNESEETDKDKQKDKKSSESNYGVIPKDDNNNQGDAVLNVKDKEAVDVKQDDEEDDDGEDDDDDEEEE
jgi:serine/threonine protein kinase